MNNYESCCTISINSLEEFEAVAQRLREHFGPIKITFEAPCIAKQFRDSMIREVTPGSIHIVPV